jgi:hypothetical protein
MAILVALIRGLARRGWDTIGNFWVDLVRSTLYILLPLSIILAVILVAQGMVQTFDQYKTVKLLQPVRYDQPVTDSEGQPVLDENDQPKTEKVTVTDQVLAVGPAASQVAIKQLGTNGGGFFNVNSAHPFENPTPFSNFVEMLSILAISGRLDRTQFGPSVPVHLTLFMQGRGRPGTSGPIDGAGRRSIYVAVRRNFLSPMMLAFDAPIPLGTVGRRNVSNVPAQALILMNDPFVAEQAQLWAKKLLADNHAPPKSRIRRMYLEALSREPTAAESAAALAFLDGQAREYGISTDAAPTDERVWADLGQVLFNVKEFVLVN